MSDDLSGDMLAPSWPNLVCIVSIFSSQLTLQYHMMILFKVYFKGMLMFIQEIDKVKRGNQRQLDT